jgi:caa(3)-type oxidase subunit IV
MATTHDPAAHHGPTFQIYMLIAAALGVFTALSFLFNYMARELHWITHGQSFALILAVAICKAALVGAVFMHLKWDWPLLYFMIVPVFILGTMMMVVFLPDAVFAWLNDAAALSEAAAAAPH